MWVIILIKKVSVLLCILLLIPNIAYSKTESISAQSAVVMDYNTSYVIYNKLKDVKVPMASTTKIMTCIIACEKGNLNSVITITSKMLDKTEGTLIYLKVGDKISLLDLIKGAMLSSGNDAANSIAFAISGSTEKFVALMNEYANKIGMTNTCFETPSGLDSNNHYSTAYDMALLTKYALSNDLFKSICSSSTDKIVINGIDIQIYNHNKLLNSDENYIGVKTGYTSKAGRCLVSAYNYNNTIIIIVTLNARDDWNDHNKLLDYAKSKYNLLSNELCYDISCVGGQKNGIKCSAKLDIAYLDNVTISAYYYPFIYAPIIKNTKVGIVKIYSNDILIGTVDITALESEKLWQTTK